MQLVDNQKIGEQLNAMPWCVLETPGDTFELLTSDRPVIRTSGLRSANGHLALPIGPRTLFVTAPEEQTVIDIAKFDRYQLATNCNQRVVEGAVRFVVGRDQSQWRFVKNRMGKVREPRLMERMTAEGLHPEMWGDPPASA